MPRNIRKWNWSGSVVTISTAIFAVVSLISVYISVTTWQIQREAARPYLTFIGSPSLSLTENNSSFEFEFKFKNVGAHPATNLSSRTLIFEQQLSQKPILIDDYTVVNDIPRDSATSLLLSLKNNNLINGSDINPHFIIISLKYSDPIVHKSYKQTIYLKWAGFIAQKQQPIIHVEMNEKESIEHYLKTYQLLE